MKIRKLLFLSIFLILGLLVFMPNTVNAENSKDYNVEVKNLEDYMCEDLKGHSLLFTGQIGFNKILVYDETNDKEYLIDFSNIGVCEEFTGQGIDVGSPQIYSWDGNNLYLETYSLDYRFENAKTIDTAVEPNSIYTELKQDGFYHVDNPTDENISNYYEGYYFELATGEYDKNASYYEIKEYHFSSSDSSTDYYDYVLATLVELEEDTYEANKYYVIAKPVKKELIGQFNSDTFVAPKEKTGLASDLTLSRFHFNYHLEIGNKTYYAFRDIETPPANLTIFDEDGNYQTFGLDNLLVLEAFGTDDNKYLSLLALIDNKYHIILLDENLNVMGLCDVDGYGDNMVFVGYNGNDFYYFVHGNEDKILKISSTETSETYAVTFDANGGKFGNENIYTIDNWDASLYDSLIKPTRDGYTFKGYYTEKTGGTKFEMILNESGLDSDMTFYAQWEAITSGGESGTPEGGEQEENNNTENTNTGNTNTGNTSTDNTNTTNTTTNKPTGNNPQTSDNIILFVTILGVSIIGLITTTRIRKKLKNN